MQRTSTVAPPARQSGGRSQALPAGEDYKRIIIANDGTWLNAARLRDQSNNPSNVTRITRAIKRQSSDGVTQIVYYHHGVGSQGGVVDRIYGGITGDGLAENCREAYQFLADNYEQGDEIFLLGFSRGAFTARAIAGFIDLIGILTRSGLEDLAEIFKDYEHRFDDDYKPKYPNKPFRNKPSASDPRYVHELARRGLCIPDVPIRAIGVWETVGALGTPRIGWLEKIGIQSSASKRMEFFDTKLSNCIEYAFQALALDERRAAFTPAVWEKEPGNKTRLRQVWFPGVHSNVGGGYPDQELANITLAWMVTQLQGLLDIDEDYVLDEQDRTEDYYEKSNQRIRPWSFGKIYNSMTGVYALGGSTTRTPGRYYRIDPDNGRATDEPLEDTCEYIHPSVRTRMMLDGPGYNDSGRYECHALKDWTLVIEPSYDDDGNPTRGRPDVYWRLKTKQENVTTRVLPESPIFGLEGDLLDMDPDREVEDYVFRPPVTPVRVSKKKEKSKRRRSRS